MFGGDLTLIDDVLRNREIQVRLPQNHPGRAFADALNERNSDHTGELTIQGSGSPHNDAYARFMQIFEVERASRLLLESRLDEERTARLQLCDRLDEERRAREAESILFREQTLQLITARDEIENRLQTNALHCATLAQNLADAQQESLQLAEKLRASDELAIRMAEDVAGIRTAQCVEYRAEAFENIETLESFISAPMTTAVRFKDLFRFMGIIGVREEVSMACGRKTHRMAPGIGHRKQRGRDGREYVTIDYRKSQAPVMLRGILAVCAESEHLIGTEDGLRCVCRECRNLMRALRRPSDFA